MIIENTLLKHAVNYKQQAKRLKFGLEILHISLNLFEPSNDRYT